MKRIVWALALLASTSVASADEGFTSTTNCYRGTYTSGCRTTVAPLPEPLYLTAEERAEQAAELAKWEAFCQPTKRQDQYGVYRFEYAQKGCDLGRTE